MTHAQEWINHPIDCQKVADLAGVPFNTIRVSSLNPIRYCKTHFMPNNLQRLQKGMPCILLSSSSDSVVLPVWACALPWNVRRWYATNVLTDHPRVTSIPIGFVYNEGRTDILKAVARSGRPAESVQLMYMNFNRFAPALKGRREGLYEQFGGLSWVTMKGGWTFDDVSPAEFYKDIQSHRFVMSPPGAGPDCHRHWESMALGSIPVVLRSLATRILDDMPALQLNSWEELTEDRLNRAWEELSPRFDSPAMRKLSMAYWKERVAACI